MRKSSNNRKLIRKCVCLVLLIIVIRFLWLTTLNRQRTPLVSIETNFNKPSNVPQKFKDINTMPTIDTLQRTGLELAVDTLSRTGLELAVDTLPRTKLELAVDVLPTTAMEPAVDTLPRTAVEPAVDTLPRTAVEPAVDTLPTTAVKPAVDTLLTTAAVEPAVDTLPTTAVKPAVDTLPTTAAVEPAVDKLPMTSVEPAVDTLPTTAVEPAVDTLPTTAVKPSLNTIKENVKGNVIKAFVNDSASSISKESTSQTKLDSKIFIDTTLIESNTLMKPSLQSPIRTKVKEVSDNDDKHAQKTHANKTLSEITYKKRTEDVQAIKTDAIPEDLKQEASNGVCDVVAKWKGIKGQFSTYDLLATVNYTTDENGNYPFPVRKYDEIAKEISSDSEILNVYLVPFSHADPGYGLTFEQYYQHKTSKTLNLMVTKLTKYPKMTFQWAETVFLERWFRDINDEAKNKVRDLVKSGRLEIVLGGWVMPDEASTHYASVVDQLIEGHTWLAEHLHVRPRTAWVNDPFGYSGTMPYLWRQAGMENLLALRINQPLKARLVTLKSLEFLWRPYHSTSAGSDVLTGLMPFTNYWVDDVCGPDPKICSMFNYLHLHEKGRRAVAVTDKNIAELSELFYKQLRITGDLYKYGSLYIGLGEDFSYVLPEEWDNVFVNFDKIMGYINNKSEWKMKIKFGTVSEYFDNVRQRETTSKNRTSGNSSDFPVISGDFFPYTERKGEFWTGYYTTRPFLKAFSRDIGSLVHAADVLNVLVTGTFRYYGVTYAGQRDAARALTDARRELGMFLHHDGITGTSLPHVIQDFEARLMKAHARAHVAMKTILTSLLSRGKVQNSAHLQEVIVKENSRDIPRYRVLDVGDGSNLVFYNPVSKRRIEIVSVYVKSKHFVINTPKKSHIEVQVTEAKVGVFMVSFEIDIPAFGIEVYKLLPKDMDHSIVKETEGFGESIELKNKYMKVVFISKTGMLQTMTLSSGNVINITADFMVYKSKRSGAYIFGPEGPATGFKTGNAVITNFHGRLWSEVAVTRPGFTQKYRLYNTDSLQGRGLHVSTSTDMASVGMREMEVIYRIKSSINNGHNFYADQNGFQLIGRETMPTQPIASNYYPATTMALLEDDRLRMTLHFRQPHGVASLASGQLDTMLDRHTFRDDGRGLGQGIYDNVNVMNEFVIEVEEKAVQFNPIEKRYTYATSEAVLLNEFLQNKLQIYTTKDNSVKLMDKVHPLKDVTLPCHTSVVGFRNIVDDDMKYSYTSLVLHRRPVHCGLTRTEDNLEHFCHVKQEKVTIKSLFPKLKVKIEETSLTLQNTKNVLELDSNILPEKNELRTFKIHM